VRKRLEATQVMCGWLGVGDVRGVVEEDEGLELLSSEVQGWWCGVCQGWRLLDLSRMLVEGGGLWRFAHDSPSLLFMCVLGLLASSHIRLCFRFLGLFGFFCLFVCHWQ
jgi:hypothetical protein